MSIRVSTAIPQHAGGRLQQMVAANGLRLAAAPVSSTRDRCSGQAHSEVMVFVGPGRGAARGRRTLPALTVQGVVEIVLTERLLKE